MLYRSNAGGTRYVFDSLRQLLARASPDRAGDRLAGLAAESGEERVAARMALADLPLRASSRRRWFLTRSTRSHGCSRSTRRAFAPIAALTVGDFRDFLLSDDATGETLAAPGAGPDAGNGGGGRQDDAQPGSDRGRAENAASSPLSATPSACRGGCRVRLQPNHPTDDPRGIAASILDGLLLRLRRRGDRHQSRHRQHRLGASLLSCTARSTSSHASRSRRRSCVLAHVTTHDARLIERGAPVDLVFQSIAGTEAANTLLRRQSGAAGGGAAKRRCR